MAGAGMFGPTPKRRRYRPSEPHELVPVDPLVCPACGAGCEDDVARTDALFRHGGFGATLRTTRRRCPVCGWASVVERSEERPPR